MQLHYLDGNATTPVAEEVLAAMLPFFRERFGNPSSLHRLGVDAERSVRLSRDEVARLMGREGDEVVFTSGGTEAANLALRGAFAAQRRRGDGVVVTAVEHACVLSTVADLERQGARVVRVPPRADGTLDMEAVLAAIGENTTLLACMHANNETGAVFPVEALATRAKAKRPGLVVFSDGVQAVGKLAPPSRAVDLYSASAHKLHGPKGVGALAVSKGVRLIAEITGGGQEKDQRSGTENVPGIVGFAMAARLATDGQAERRARWAALRARLLAGVRELGGLSHSPEDGLAGTLAVAFPGAPAEPVLHGLEERGVIASSGSACASRKGARASHVLLAMGLDEARRASALRFSFTRDTTEATIDAALAALKDALARVRPVAKR